MTAGCYYDNASFLSEEDERRLQLLKQQQQRLEQQKQLLQVPEKPTLLALSPTASFRLSPSSRRPSANLEDQDELQNLELSPASEANGMEELLARQIDQQRLSQPPLSRNPSVRYSRRFPPPSADLAAAAAAAVSGAKVTEVVQMHQQSDELQTQLKREAVFSDKIISDLECNSNQ